MTNPSPIGYLPQDVQLFDDTIAANIARFCDAPPAAVMAAARRAGAHDLIVALPQGYLTRISQTDGILSGGMKQRIGLARAVFGRPRLVVLDEPNANLDRAGDAALATCIRALQADGTAVVLVSHRPECTSLMNRLLVLMDGRLVAQGSREDVLQTLKTAHVAPERGAPRMRGPAGATRAAADLPS
ncbi:MAG: ATP-binding cassette domain-containing protein [Hyphomicrobiaceae bacterium]